MSNQRHEELVSALGSLDEVTKLTNFSADNKQIITQWLEEKQDTGFQTVDDLLLKLLKVSLNNTQDKGTYDYLVALNDKLHFILSDSPELLDQPIRDKNFKRVIQMLSAGVNPNGSIHADEPNQAGTTHLFIAFYFGTPEIIEVLLKAGANPGQQNRDSFTVQQLAYQNKKGDITAIIERITQIRSQRLELLLNYTKENSKYPLSEKKICQLIALNSTNRKIINDWLNAEDDCTPRKLIKKLHEHAKQVEDDAAWQITGRALLRKPMSNPPTESELKKAQAKRLKVILKKVGEDTVNALKKNSEYNSKQIDAWINFSGEVWSQERYTIDHLLLVLRHVASYKSDFETLKLFNENLPHIQFSDILGRNQLEDIRKITDRLSPEEIAARKQKILDLGLSEEDFSELQRLMDGLFNNQPPIKLWLEAKGLHQHLNAKELFDALFHDVLYEHTYSKRKSSCELFDFLINHKLFPNDPSVLAKNLNTAIVTQNNNRAHFVRALIELGAPCDIPVDNRYPLSIALCEYYINSEVFEIILTQGKGVDVYQKIEWGKNALELAEEFSEKHKNDPRYDFKKPLEMLREHAKKNRPDHVEKKQNFSVTVDKETKSIQISEHTAVKDQSEEELHKPQSSREDIVQSTADSPASNLVNNVLFNQISSEISADEKIDELIKHLSLQWSARGKCPIKKSDLEKSMEAFIEKIVTVSLSTTAEKSNHSTAFKLIRNESSLELDLEKLSEESPEVISAIQNLIAYGIKLDHENSQKPNSVVEAKINSLATFIRTVLQQPELSAKSIQDAYDAFEKEDKNTRTGFYRVYSFFYNKRYDGVHLVKSTTGELVYDLMQALKSIDQPKELL